VVVGVDFFIIVGTIRVLYDVQYDEKVRKFESRLTNSEYGVLPVPVGTTLSTSTATLYVLQYPSSTVHFKELLLDNKSCFTSKSTRSTGGTVHFTRDYFSTID
jgi:hypothetical protein